MWLSIKNWFWNSETIFFARFQVAFGIVWGVVSMIDMSPLIPGKYLTIWFIVSGIITEILRRKRTTAESVIVSEIKTDGTTEPVKVAFLSSEPPGP